MSHPPPTWHKSKSIQYIPASSKEDIQEKEPYNHQKEQELLLISLIPFEIEQTIYSILSDHHDNKSILSDVECKEANQIWNIITELKSKSSKIKMFSHHFPIMCRLQDNIDLFTYMKYNHELIKRYPRIAMIYHDYYAYFSTLYRKFWKQVIDPTCLDHKSVNSQYCTLLATIKNVIHSGELILINEKLLTSCEYK